MNRIMLRNKKKSIRGIRTNKNYKYMSMFITKIKDIIGNKTTIQYIRILFSRIDKLIHKAI